MKNHRFALALTAGAMGVMALIGGTGVARAEPEPPPPPVPVFIDQLITATPALSVDPNNEGNRSIPSNGVGMYCENQWALCR